jgi:uncharacterized protein YceH (UPF0502 family)
VKIQLTPTEARILGALIEKEITTPDQYPLSLNALTAACNQKSNRDPVLSLSEALVQETVDGLVKRYLVARASGFSSRVVKYRHRFCNAEFGDVKLAPEAVAILCELLLRGPQTPGELRTRADRLCPLTDVQRVETVLDELMAREEPFVTRLAREPGKREARYAHLFFGDLPATAAAPAYEMPAPRAVPAEPAVDSLAARVEDLARELAALKRRLAELVPGFDPDADDA